VKIIKRIGAMIKLLITQPSLAREVISAISGTKKYTIAAIAQHFSSFLNPLESKPKTVDELLKEQNFTDKALFLELLGLLEKAGYLKIENETVYLRKKIPDNILEEAEKNISPTVRKSFSQFARNLKSILFIRLAGKAPTTFDENELRVLWNIALKGRFYTLQRERCFKFVRLAEFVASRKPPVRILDYGCGTGNSTIELYEFLKKNNLDFELHACDVSEGLLEIAKEDEALTYPIHFFSLLKQKPREGYYDAIFLGQVIHWFEDPVEMIGTLKSYLKPGGMLFGVESIYSKNLYYINLFLRILGSRGFPTKEEFFEWFEKNDMKLEYDFAVYAFKAVAAQPSR